MCLSFHYKCPQKKRLINSGLMIHHLSKSILQCNFALFENSFFSFLMKNNVNPLGVGDGKLHLEGGVILARLKYYTLIFFLLMNTQGIFRNKLNEPNWPCRVNIDTIIGFKLILLYFFLAVIRALYMRMLVGSSDGR